jgi:hypothetical protein
MKLARTSKKLAWASFSTLRYPESRRPAVRRGGDEAGFRGRVRQSWVEGLAMGLTTEDRLEIMDLGARHCHGMATNDRKIDGHSKVTRRLRRVAPSHGGPSIGS